MKLAPQQLSHQLAAATMALSPAEHFRRLLPQIGWLLLGTNPPTWWWHRPLAPKLKRSPYAGSSTFWSCHRMQASDLSQAGRWRIMRALPLRATLSSSARDGMWNRAVYLARQRSLWL